MSKVVPNIPPVSGVTDPNTRAVLQALSDGMRVRNGEVGEGGEKFITVKELEAALTGDPNSGTGTSQLVGNRIATAMQEAINAFLNSRVVKLINERMAWIERPEWFDAKVKAATRNDIELIQGETQAMAKTIETNVAEINDNLALVQQELTATADAAGAAASAVTQLQTDVGGVQSIAQEALTLSQTTEGTVNGAWTVKFDANGYVVGAGLGVEGKGGTFDSTFAVQADRFAIKSPVGDKVPFLVDATGAYFDTNMIVNGSITAAKIDSRGLTIRDNAGNIILGSGTGLDWSRVTGLGALATLNQVTGTYIANLTVDTINVLDGSITKVSAASSQPNLNISTTGYYNGATVTGPSFTTVNGVLPRVLINAAIHIDSFAESSKSYTFHVRRNGSDIFSVTSVTIKAKADLVYAIPVIDNSPSSSATYSVGVTTLQGSTNQQILRYAAITVQALRR